MDIGSWRLIGVMALAVSSASSGFAGETIRVGGNGSSMPLIQQLADLYRKNQPDTKVVIMTPPIGSRGSMRALAAGQLDLAISAVLPKPETAAKLAQPVAWVVTPIVLAGRDVENISFTRQQLADIYAGKLKQWPDGKPIRLMLRSADVSDTEKLRTLSPQLDAALSQALARHTQPVGGDALESLKILETTPNSLGSTTLGLILTTRSKLKPVAIDGVMPGIAAVRDGSYPLAKPLFLLTGKIPTHATRAFVDFLRSPAAIEFMRRLEYVPLAP